MLKGKRGMPGGMDIGSVMKQAQKMQKQVAELQTELETKKYEVTAGGGAVRVVITGKKQLEELEISPDIVNSDDIEMLQDLLIVTVNEALRQVEDDISAQMGKLTGGLGLPGGLS